MKVMMRMTKILIKDKECVTFSDELLLAINLLKTTLHLLINLILKYYYKKL